MGMVTEYGLAEVADERHYLHTERRVMSNCNIHTQERESEKWESKIKIDKRKLL